MFPATSRIPKRCQEEETVDFPKRQHQGELQTLSQASRDFSGSYNGVNLEYTPESLSSSPSVHLTYQATPNTQLQNTGAAAGGYQASHNEMYASDPIYGDFNTQSLPAVAHQPRPVPPVSYGYPGYPYQHYLNGLPSSPIRALNVPGVPVFQVSHKNGPHYAFQPSMTASSLPQQQSVEERLFSALTAAGYGQKISSSTTVELSAQEKLYAEQNQWLAKAEADLQGHAINVVPGIHIQQGALGTATCIINDLIPSEVWSLRSLSPSLRYCAYRMMTEEAREMIRYDQASEEFQRRWACILNLRAFLMQKEKEWVESFQQIINTHRRAFWDQKVEEQAVETPVTQVMIDAFETSKMKSRGLSPVGVTVENETLQTAPSEPAPSTKKAVQKHRSSTCKPDAASVASVKPPKPDTIKHPLDKVAVPKYPFDNISDFTPNEDGMYQCMHEFGRNWPCCISGLDEDRMKQAIYRSISTWKSQVERLIGRGYLHPSHMTWRTHQNQALRRNRIAAERKRAELQLRSEGREVAQSGKEEKKGQEQRSTAEDMTKASQGKKKRQGLQRRPREDDASRRSSSVPAPDSPQQHAIAPKALPNGVATRLTSDWDIARVNMRDKQEFEDCRRAEQQKKSPNWPRFEEWWAARLLQVQCLQLSKDQKMVLKRLEPSSIEDNDPVFVEKTKDLLPAHVQKSVDAKENVVSDDSDLDDLFNDDASSREET